MEKVFGEWAEQVIRMRLIQEYETIKGLLVTAELAKTMGLPALEKAMARCRKSSVKKPSASPLTLH